MQNDESVSTLTALLPLLPHWGQNLYNYHDDSPKVVHLWNICLFQIEDFQRLVDDEHLVLPADKPVWIGVRHSEEAGYRY